MIWVEWFAVYIVIKKIEMKRSEKMKEMKSIILLHHYWTQCYSIQNTLWMRVEGSEITISSIRNETLNAI